MTQVERAAVHLGDERIDAATVIWAAGVTASPLGASLGISLDKGGRVPVEPDLRLKEHPDIFVIGDLAALKDGQGNLLPGLAPVATQEGEAAAKNIVRAINGERTTPFHYRDRGNIATIGRNRAVAVIYGIKTRGFVAWAIWVFIHILTLIGYRNRFAVMAQWTYAYLTHRRPARLIRAEKADFGSDNKNRQDAKDAKKTKKKSFFLPTWRLGGSFRSFATDFYAMRGSGTTACGRSSPVAAPHPCAGAPRR